ncbi:hypothetical protein OKA04_13240 [Luteolibacter flavescens]|uniref:Uncharacterized protein n=1 Tax=Luteolibacter flavescens TaxID=1859460 RepID=A0ABT3FQ42_9BACT|nr:hypothetical protein [Luteolibacter flavescens]MCW1885698.1 hypothetical protein [Luteolibacter flavescens]
MRPEITLAALMLPWPLAAQQPSTPPPAGVTEEAAPATPAADFSDGLSRLATLGLPDMKGATWVRAPKDVSESIDMPYEFQSLGVKLQGGAWKLPGDKPRWIGFGTSEIIEIEPDGEEEAAAPEENASPGLLERMMRNHAASQPKKEKQARPGITVEEDVKRLIEALGKQSVIDRLIERLEYDSDVLSVPAHCLIFAAQLHATGHADAGNRLAAAVFAAFPDATRNVDAAVGYLASLEAIGINDNFFESQDWKAYRDALKALLEKYPRGWGDATGIALLMPALDKRVAGELPPAPTLPGITLKPEAVAALGKFLEAQTAPEGDDIQLPDGMDLSGIPAEHRAEFLQAMRRQGAMTGMATGRGGIWILPERKPGDSRPMSGPVSDLQAMGMDGLIALAAVADDPTLVPVRTESSYSTSYGIDEDDEPQEIYDRLDRPKSRGEIARSVISSTIPRSDDSGETDPIILRDAAVDFWKKNREKSPIELAVIFTREGDERQRMEAANYLAGGDDESRQAFEKLALGSDQPSDYSAVVESYLAERKTEARAFFDGYSKAVTRELDGVDLSNARSSGVYRIRAAGSVEKYLKKLSISVGAVSLDDLIAEALKEPSQNGQINGDQPMASLGTSMMGAPLEDCLKAVAAVETKATPEQWLDLHQILLSRAYRGGRGQSLAKEKTLPKDVIDLWRPLIAKSDPLPPKHRFASWVQGYGGSKMGDASYMILEVAAHPETSEYLNIYLQFCEAPDTPFAFIKKRVDAWTGGKEPIAWPDAEDVEEARSTEITTKLAGLPAAEIPASIKSLGVAERIAVGNWTGEFDEDSPAPSGIMEVRDRIVEIRPYNPAQPHDPALLAALGIKEGDKVEADDLVKLAEKLATEAKDRSGTTVAYYSMPTGLGMFCSAARKNDPDSFSSDYALQSLAQWFERFEDADVLAMVATQEAADFWAVKDGKVQALPQEDRDSSAIESLKKHFASKSVGRAYFMAAVLTREDAEKLGKGDSEDDESEE